MSLLSIDEMIAKGMGRSMTVGAFSTGIVGGGAGTFLDLDQPEFAVGVPAGYVIRPIRIAVQVQPGAATTDADETEILIGVDVLGLVQILSAETSVIENPVNLRSDLGRGSACRTASAFSANMTTINAVGTSGAPVLDMELAREVQTLELATAAAQNLYLVRLLYEPRYPPFIVGPATLLGYWGGTVATVGGFAQVEWVEGKKSDMLAAV